MRKGPDLDGWLLASREAQVVEGKTPEQTNRLVASLGAALPIPAPLTLAARLERRVPRTCCPFNAATTRTYQELGVIETVRGLPTILVRHIWWLARTKSWGECKDLVGDHLSPKPCKFILWHWRRRRQSVHRIVLDS